MRYLECLMCSIAYKAALLIRLQGMLVLSVHIKWGRCTGFARERFHIASWHTLVRDSRNVCCCRCSLAAWSYAAAASLAATAAASAFCRQQHSILAYIFYMKLLMSPLQQAAFTSAK